MVVPRVRQVLAEELATVLVDQRNLVEPEPVDVVFVEEHPGVANKKLADVRLTVVKNLPAHLSAGREIDAVGVVGRRGPGKVVEALVIQVATGMIVDNVRKHRDAV